MRIYVAAKFQEVGLVRETYRVLRAAGHEISHDWTDEDAERVAEEDRDEYLVECANDATNGVMDADAVVLFPHEHSQGAYVELGMAIAEHIPVVVVCLAEDMPACIFLKCDGVNRVDDLDAMLRELQVLERHLAA